MLLFKAMSSTMVLNPGAYPTRLKGVPAANHSEFTSMKNRHVSSTADHFYDLSLESRICSALIRCAPWYPSIYPYPLLSTPQPRFAPDNFFLNHVNSSPFDLPRKTVHHQSPLLWNWNRQVPLIMIAKPCCSGLPLYISIANLVRAHSSFEISIGGDCIPIHVY